MRQVKCSCVVQTRLIPKQSLYRKINAAQLYSQVSSYSNHYTASSVQLSCTAISHHTEFTIPHVQCSFLHSKVSSHSIHYTASLVQLCFTAKSYPSAVTILPIHCRSVVQPSLIPHQSLYCQFSASLLYSQVSSHSSHYTDRSGQVCCSTKSQPTAVTILTVLCSYVVQPSLIPQQTLY